MATTSTNDVIVNADVEITSPTTTALTVAAAGSDYGLQIDESASGAVTGLKITADIQGNGVTLSAISPGPDEDLIVNALGGGNIVLAETSGNVGIGTAAPLVPLDVVGDIRSNGGYVRSTSSSLVGSGDVTQIFHDGATGSLEVSYFSGAYTPLTLRTSGLERVRVDVSGNVGIGTTNPSAQLHTTGTVRFANFGAGNAMFDANGNVSSSSSERLKDIQGVFSRGFRDLEDIQPILFKWNKTSGLETEQLYAGFSAENVQRSIPEAVGEKLSLSDRPIVAALLNAVKELGLRVQRLERQLDISNPA